MENDGKLQNIIDNMIEGRATGETESTETEQFLDHFLAAIERSLNNTVGSSSSEDGSESEESEDGSDSEESEDVNSTDPVAKEPTPESEPASSNSREAMEQVQRLELQLETTRAKAIAVTLDLAPKNSVRSQTVEALIHRVHVLEGLLALILAEREQEASSIRQLEKEMQKCLAQAVGSIFCYHSVCSLLKRISNSYRRTSVSEFPPQVYVSTMQSVIKHYRRKNFQAHINSLVRDANAKDELIGGVGVGQKAPSGS
ncbi:hypothetical protein R1flu_027959 [Riccia fluitans]|uniref:Uncharacterized protein n=1 Tax=Riccia fluitans TaxID=41844 RepID=A0ABD1XN92_9MARC